MNSFDERYQAGRVYRLMFGHASDGDVATDFARQDVVVTKAEQDHIEGYRASVSENHGSLRGDADPEDGPHVRIKAKPYHIRKAAVVIKRCFGDLDEVNIADDQTGEYLPSDEDEPEVATDGGRDLTEDVPSYDAVPNKGEGTVTARIPSAERNKLRRGVILRPAQALSFAEELIDAVEEVVDDVTEVEEATAELARELSAAIEAQDDDGPDRMVITDEFVVDHAVPADDAATFVHVGLDGEYHPTAGYWFPSDLEPDDDVTGVVDDEDDVPRDELIQYPRDDKAPRIVGRDDLPEWVQDRNVDVVTDGGVTVEELREATSDFFDDDVIETADYSHERETGIVVVEVEEVDAGFTDGDTFDVEDFDDHLNDYGFEYTGYAPAPAMTQVNVAPVDGGEE